MNSKKPIHKKWWFWVILILVVIGIIGSFGNLEGENEANQDQSSKVVNTTEKDNKTANEVTANKTKVSVVDFSSMDQAAIQSWADENKVKCQFAEEYSDSVPKGSLISQSKKAGEAVDEGSTIKIVMSLGKKPPVEYTNALRKAESYSKTMHMSKQGIYDQLTSEYGEQFPADAAQYAIDNMQADWNANALEKAKSYQKIMSMSKNAIYDQLISEYGEQFTEEEAQYAIDHLDD